MSGYWKKVYRSISTKLIVIILLLVIPLNILAHYGVTATTDRLMKQVSLTEQNLVDNYMSELSARMKNTSSLLYYYLTEDANCMRMVKSRATGYEYDSAKLRCYYSIKHMAGLIAGGDGYFYYMKSMDDLLSYTKSPSDNISSYIAECISDGAASRGWKLVEIMGRQFLVLFMYENNYIYGGWLNLETVKEEIGKSLAFENSRMSFSESLPKPEKDTIQAFASYKGIYLNIFLDQQVILAGMTAFERLQRATPFIFTLLLPILFLVFQFLLIRPLREVNEAHRQISRGHPEYRIVKKSSSVEYEEAFASFNRMADEMQNLKIESYERELAIQTMKLRNLQLQIQPHFLLNTFNLIHTLAQKKETEAIQNSTIYLSEYFRYIFRGDKELELFDKELHLMEGYQQLANVRYPEGVAIIWTFDPEIQLVRIPPLLLLNFVENAVKYGYQDGEKLHITITGEYLDGIVTFYIINDGNEMDPQMYERNQKIFSGELEPEGESQQHFGLYNSLRRLKYFYGDTAVIELTCDEETRETVFCIRFPYNLEEENDFVDN